MSDQHSERNRFSGEWQPFAPDNLERYDADDLNNSKQLFSDSDRAFKVLYEGDKKKEETAIFIPLYTPSYDNKDGLSEEKLDQTGRFMPDTDIKPSDRQSNVLEIEHKAYEEGFARGEQEGLDAGQEKASEIIQHLESILKAFENLWTRMVQKYETQIIQLVCRSAEKVVCGQVEVENDIVKRSILNAFKIIPEPVDISICVNPEDYEYIEIIKDDFFEQVKELKNVSVLSDLSIHRGGCKIATRSGTVDSSIESRMDAIKRSLLEANGKRNENA